MASDFVIADNPELTTRIPNGRNPIRVILDSTLKIPVDSKVISDKLAETWLFTSNKYDHDKKSVLNGLGITIFHTTSSEKVDPSEVIKILGEKGISSLLIEGGGTINASFLEHHLIDKAIIYIAPKLIGGKQAPTFLEGTGYDKMVEAIELHDTEIVKIGNDFKFVGYPKYKK